MTSLNGNNAVVVVFLSSPFFSLFFWLCFAVATIEFVLTHSGIPFYTLSNHLISLPLLLSYLIVSRRSLSLTSLRLKWSAVWQQFSPRIYEACFRMDIALPRNVFSFFICYESGKLHRAHFDHVTMCKNRCVHESACKLRATVRNSEG